MLRIFAVVAAFWIAILPPFFTNGACSAEFQNATARIERDKRSLASPEQAAAYFSKHGIQHRRARQVVYAQLPVDNLVCRIYRDGEIRLQLHYDERGRLARIVTEMAPSRHLPLPWTGRTLDWAS